MNYKINTKKRTVAVLGLGITGKSIIDYFKNSEIELICWDDNLIKRKQLINQKLDFIIYLILKSGQILTHYSFHQVFLTCIQRLILQL